MNIILKRGKDRNQYNKRAVLHNYKPGDRVLLDIREVKKGDSKKFTSKYKGPYRVIKVNNNHTAEIADSSFRTKLVHCNRLKPLFETMLWTDEPMPDMESTVDPRERFRKQIATQTNWDSNEESDIESIDENNTVDSEESEATLDLDPPVINIPNDDILVELNNDVDIPSFDLDEIEFDNPPVNIPHPRPLSPIVTIINNNENIPNPIERPRLRPRSAIKPKSRLIAEV